MYASNLVRVAGRARRCIRYHTVARAPAFSRSLSALSWPLPSRSSAAYRSETTKSSSSRLLQWRRSFSTAPSSQVGPTSSEMSARPFELRPYQIDCINTILDTLVSTSISRLGISSPTGSGKTAIFTELIPRLPARIHPDSEQLANRVLVLVGSIQLAKQAAEVISSTYPHLDVEIEQGNNEASGFADVTVATFQTLSKGDFTRLDKFEPSAFKAVIVDEAHHAAAQSYVKILSRFDPRISEVSDPIAIGLEDDDITQAPILPSNSSETHPSPPHLDPLPFDLSPQGELCVPILGFTATFSRADGLALGKVIEKIVWHASWVEMIEAGYLSEIRFTTVRLGSTLDLKSVTTSKKTGEFVIASLANAVDKTVVNELCVQAWKDKAEGRRMSTLVFAVNIHHVVSLTNQFRENGIEARFVHEGIKEKERDMIYDAFRRGEISVLVNCGILTEGADFPFIDCILLARPTKSRNLFQQMIGRGMRKSPRTGKEDCLMIDIVGNSTEGIICTPTLFGIDPNLAIEDGATIKQLRKMATEAPAPRTPRFPFTFGINDPILEYEEFNKVADFVSARESSDSNGRSRLSRLTRNAWVGVGDDVFVLDLMGRGYIRVLRTIAADDGSPEAQKWEAKGYLRLYSGDYGKIVYSKPNDLGSHSDLKIMFSMLDAVVAHSPTWKPSVSVYRHADWRFEGSTTSQHKFIMNKLKSEVDEEGRVNSSWIPGREQKDKWIELKELNKGEACDLISRCMHGAIKSMRKMRKQVERKQKYEEKEKTKRVLELGL